MRVALYFKGSFCRRIKDMSKSYGRQRLALELHEAFGGTVGVTADVADWLVDRIVAGNNYPPGDYEVQFVICEE